jgi:hypothetical protein
MDIPTPPGILTDDEYEQIMGAGGPAAAPESERSFWLAQVNQYRAFRVSAPREKDLEAQRQRLSRLDALALDPDGEAKRLQLDTILTASPEQQAAAKDALLIDSMLAERASRRVPISGSVWDANKPPSVLAADRDAARDALAVEMFGETAPRGSDAAVAGKLREAAGDRQKLRWIIAGRDPSPSQQQLPTNVPASMHGPLMFPVDTKQDAETKAINEASLARNAWRAGLAGLPVAEAFAQWKEAARKSPAWSPAADKQDFFQQFKSVYAQADAKSAPLREKVRTVVENILKASRAEGEGAESMMGGGEVVRLAAMTKQITDAMAPLEDMDPETLRSVVMPTVRALAETRKDPDGRDMWDKIVASFRRPIARSLGASWDILSSLTSTAPMMGTPTPETAALVMEERQAIARRDIARSLLREATVSVIDPILTSAKSAAGKLAEQAVYDVAGSLGYMATTAIPYAGMAMTAASFADQNLANLLTSNPTMKVADAGVLAWAAAPVQAGLEKIQQMGLIGKLPGFNRAMNALAGPGGNPLARFALYGAVATGAEFTIEKLQDATPMLAQDLLASLKEDVPNADWRNFEMFDLRTLLAVAPLALIGAGVNVARDAAATRELMSSTAAMKAVGMTDEAIEAVKAAPTVQAKMEAVADGYAQRDADTEPDVAWQETAAGAIADEELAAARDLAEQSDAVGIRAVRRNSDGSFTVVANDGSAIEAASAQEAADVIERISDEAQDWSNVAALAEISEALDMRPNAPTGASQTTIRDSMSVAEVIEEQTAIANDPDATLAERTAAQNYITNLQNRVEIYEAANKGKKVDLRTLMVGGQSEMEVREGVATAVVQVARGASPYTVLEERVEADVTAMLRSGEETTATFAAKIEEIQKRTGGQYLFGYTGTDAAKDSLAVKEALSLLTQIYVTGKARAGQAGTAAVPRIVREYRKGTRAKLKAAEAEGVAKSVFDYLKSRVQWLKTIIKQAIRLNRAMAESRAKGEEFPLESFLQRVTGVAPGIEAAQEVETEAELVYNPPDPDDDVMAFNLTEEGGPDPRLISRVTNESLAAIALSQASWRDWYASHQALLDEFFGDHAGIFQTFLSVTSQATTVKANVTLALKAYGQWIRGVRFSGYLPAVKKNLQRVRDDQQLAGQKITTYARTNEGAEEVVVDRHIARLLFDTDSPTAAQFKRAQEILTQVAQEIGWKPQQVQAALWAASIVKSGKTVTSYEAYLRKLDAKNAISSRIRTVRRAKDRRGKYEALRNRRSIAGAMPGTGQGIATGTSFNLTEQDARHAELERRAKARDAAAEEEAQAMVDAVARAGGMRPAYHSGAEIMEGGTIRAPFFYMTEQRRDAEAHNFGKTTKWFVNLRNPKWVPEHDDRFMDFRGRGFDPGSPEIAVTESALEYTQFLKSQGYDGIVMPSEMDDPEGPFLHGNNYIAFEPEQIKSADPFTYDEAGNLVPLSKRFDVTRPEISFSLIQAQHLRNDTRFDALQKAGRVQIGGDIDDFTGQHIMLHSPDNAFAGTITLPGGETIEGKGGVYYPALYAKKNYFWASTKAVAERTAKHLNESGRKNGGRILMGLVSAPVEKLFSSSTGAIGAVKFLKSLTTIKGSGLTERMLHLMLIRASKAKAERTGHEFGFKLDPADDFQTTMANLPALLSPDNAIFAVRKAFVESLADQLAKAMKAKPKSAKLIAGILADAENKHAKNQILAGKLSKASIMQGMGNLLTEPFLRVFQEFEAGRVYAVVEVIGPVKAIPSAEHESYPYAIVPENPKNKVKLTVLSQAVDWQDAIGKEEGDYTTKEERFVYLPTAGMSAPDLKVLGRRSSAAANPISFSLQPEAMLDNVAANVEARMARSPQARLDMVARARDNLTALKDSFLRGRTGGFTPERSVASLQSEQDMRQAVREQELLQAAGVSLTSAQDIRIGRADAYRAELANQLAARGVEEKSPQRIRREANFRQALEREKMLAQTDEDYSRSLSQIYREFGFWDGTVMSFLSRKTKGTRTGILMSYRKAQRFAGKGEFVNHGPWDGSEELPRILFSGTTQPDVAAMELFSAHPEVFPSGTTATDVTPDMLWDAIGRELAENEKLAGVWDDYQKAVKATEQQAKDWGDAWVENYRRQLAEARADAERAGNAYVAEATGNNTQAVAAAAQARQEAADWRKRADRWQAADWNDKAVLTRAMRTLDAILAAFPPDIRGKVGGWLSLARLGSAESMAKEIGRRIDMLDRELEKSLRADAIERIRDLIDTAKPKREAGKKPTGKIGAAAHRYFDAMASVVDMSAAEVDAMRLALDTELAAATTPEQQADIWEKQQILDTFGGLEAKDAAGVPLHDAADLEAALAQAQQVYTTGRNYWRTIEEARLADIAGKTAATAAAMPAVKVQALLAQGDAAKRITGMLRNTSLSLRSFREILEILLGRTNPLAQQWADMAMDAMHQRTDDMRKLSRRWFEAARASTKMNRQKTEEALWGMITSRTVAVTLRPGQPVAERIPIERIPNMTALGYNAQEIADAEAAFDALPLDTQKEYVEIERWQPGAEEAVELTQAEAIYISMLAAQEQYTSPLARAGWGTETMQELEAALSPLAKDMRSFMADEYRDGYYPLASLFEGMFGVSLPQIENYAPGKWWSRGAEKAMDPTQAGLVEGGFRAGFLKGRKAHQAAPKVANAFEVFFGHANQTAHWRAMAPLARELRAVFADPGIKQQITAAHGPEMLATVNRWLESLEGNGLQVGYSQAYQNLLSWQATVALAWKVGTLMKQSTAMLGSAFKIPFRAYMRGMGRFISGNLDVTEIWQSDMIQRRVESGFSPEVRLAVAKTMTAKPTRREYFLRKGMELIGYVDAAFTTISAAIAYDYHLEQAKAAGLSDTAAKRQAMSETQRIVTQTAQPVEVTDRSLFEQTGWGKMLLMFGGDSRQKASMWVTALAAAIRGKATPDDIRVLAISHLIIGPMLQVITSAWMDWRDDDDDEIFDEKNWEGWDMARSVLLGPAAGLPLIREIVDDFSGDSGPLAATGKAAADVAAIVKGPTDSEPEKVEWYGKRIAGVLKGLSAFPAVLAGIGDQLFRVSDNLIETDDEIRAKIQTLQRKLEREKDREEQDAIRERILGLQSKLK